VCDHKELNDTDVLTHVVEDATKFILASSEVLYRQSLLI
jgi:hypothetical protein